MIGPAMQRSAFDLREDLVSVCLGAGARPVLPHLLEQTLLFDESGRRKSAPHEEPVHQHS